MADEGSRDLMAELILMEKEERAKLEAIQEQLDIHEPRLAKARALVLKAKAKYDEVNAIVAPLQSDKILIQGELASIDQQKSECRVEARLTAGRGVRPGTSEFVNELQKLAGDPEEYKAQKDAEALDVEAELAALKAKLAGEDASG